MWRSDRWDRIYIAWGLVLLPIGLLSAGWLYRTGNGPPGIALGALVIGITFALMATDWTLRERYFRSND